MDLSDAQLSYPAELRSRNAPLCLLIFDIRVVATCPCCLWQRWFLHEVGTTCGLVEQFFCTTRKFRVLIIRCSCLIFFSFNGFVALCLPTFFFFLPPFFAGCRTGQQWGGSIEDLGSYWPRVGGVSTYFEPYLTIDRHTMLDSMCAE